jgi:hypothetical protein
MMIKKENGRLRKEGKEGRGRRRGRSKNKKKSLPGIKKTRPDFIKLRPSGLKNGSQSRHRKRSFESLNGMVGYANIDMDTSIVNPII